MEVDLSLGDLFRKAFGYESPAFDPKFETVGGDTPAFQSNNGSAAGTPFYASDLLGREVYLPIRIKYPEAGANSTTLVDWMLFYAVVSIDSAKTIVKTSLTERNGDVVELINSGGYAINIKAFLINQVTNEMPEADLIILRKVCETSEPIWLQCALTDIFVGNRKVVVTRMRVPEVRGIKNVRPIELDVITDENFNLIDLQ